MKIRNIKFDNHEILKNLEVSFTDKEGNTLDTIVLIGSNGSGKTSLLKGLYDNFDLVKVYKNKTSVIEIENSSEEVDFIINKRKFTNEELSILTNEELRNFRFGNDCFDKLIKFNLVENQSENLNPKVVFLPTEINFEVDDVKDKIELENKFLNIVNQEFAKNIPSLISSRIDTEVFKNQDLAVKESVRIICDEMNAVFDVMEIDVKLIGISTDGLKKPIFKNTNGDIFDINNLSSGEKQLFLRALSLKFLDVNDSIILIDEPEISLHPKWQQKIIKVYENIGKNNQLIIATHSPHILSDIKSEQLRVIKRDEEGIKIIDEIDETYGHKVDSILRDIMDLKVLRNEETEKDIQKLRDLLDEDNYENEEFTNIYNKLKSYLGAYDIDLNLIDLDIKRRKKGR